uniref:Alpha-amylase type B isozyme n=1 Tax=Aegilops tauschii TaxID=37682 RepID=M8C0J3_AEGTA
MANKHLSLSLFLVLLGLSANLASGQVLFQFYDHFFDWGLKEEIDRLVSIRTRHGIHSESKLQIIEADSDLYLAEIDGKVIVKLGPRYDVGHLIPGGFKVAAHGNDYAVWEKI